MANRGDPFDDILSPQPRSAQAPAFQQDPFDDDDPFDNARAAHSGPSQGQARQGGGVQGQGQHGYALDPFFDEQVQIHAVGASS